MIWEWMVIKFESITSSTKGTSKHGRNSFTFLAHATNSNNSQMPLILHCFYFTQIKVWQCYNKVHRAEVPQPIANSHCITLNTPHQLRRRFRVRAECRKKSSHAPREVKIHTAPGTATYSAAKQQWAPLLSIGGARCALSRQAGGPLLSTCRQRDEISERSRTHSRRVWGIKLVSLSLVRFAKLNHANADALRLHFILRSQINVYQEW